MEFFLFLRVIIFSNFFLKNKKIDSFDLFCDCEGMQACFNSIKNSVGNFIPFVRKNTPTLATLPLEIQVRILSYLEADEWQIISCLSKRWRVIACCDDLWRETALSCLPNLPNPRTKSYIEYIREESQKQTKKYKEKKKPDYETIYTNKYPLLRKIIFRNFFTPELTQFEYIMDLPFLNRFIDDDCGEKKGKLTDRHLQSIVELFPNLNTFKLRGKNEVTDDGLEKILPQLINLRSLELWDLNFNEKTFEKILLKNSWLYNLTFSNSLILSDAVLSLMSSHCAHLRKLDICDLKGRFSSKSFTNVIEKLKGLKKLALTVHYDFDDKFLSLILKSSPAIEYLSLHNCNKLTVQAIQELFRNASKLKFVNFFQCNSQVKTYYERKEFKTPFFLELKIE